MNRDWYKPLVLLMWLALPATAWRYWQAWDQFPMRMAVHFDANWQPNGYTSREGALMLGLGIMGFMLIVFTVAALIAHALKPGSAWPVLLISYVALGILWYANSFIVDFNLSKQPAHSELVGCPPAVKDSQQTGFPVLHS